MVGFLSKNVLRRQRVLRCCCFNCDSSMHINPVFQQSINLTTICEVPLLSRRRRFLIKHQRTKQNWHQIKKICSSVSAVRLSSSVTYNITSPAATTRLGTDLSPQRISSHMSIISVMRNVSFVVKIMHYVRGFSTFSRHLLDVKGMNAGGVSNFRQN